MALMIIRIMMVVPPFQFSFEHQSYVAFLETAFYEYREPQCRIIFKMHATFYKKDHQK